MNELTIEDFKKIIYNYPDHEKETIMKAYSYAEQLHKGQYRQSGEEYIIHPLNVAYILADMKADCDTICAGLLHDTLEDTPIKREDLVENFNEEVAKLVDGVTKISNLDYSTKEELNLANTRKIITGITEDVRIIIIKLADRLHNMRTLEFKNEYKQKEKSIETMDIFVPLAYYIGSYRIKSELEDISLQYLKPEMYKRVEEQKYKIEEDSKNCIEEMYKKINAVLDNENIPHEVKIRTKNIYGIYKNLAQGKKLCDIHDLLALKIMTSLESECYRTLGLIHHEYHPLNERFRDHLCNPKANLYQSLHTTVFGPDERLIQAQIRTFDMDKIASFGLTAYWDINKGNARYLMQKDLKEKFQFFKSLVEINSIFGDNQDFVHQVQNELFAEKVYIYTTKGDILELPKGSTIIDFAYKINTDVGNTLVAAIVNDEYKELDYILQNKDRVQVVTDPLSFGPRTEWEHVAQTTHAKEKIKEFTKK